MNRNKENSMPYIFELFDELPKDLQIEIVQTLSNSDLLNVSMTSTYHLALFKPMINVGKLLHHVVCGEHDAVQWMLKDDISLILKKGEVTDCSGRIFDNVSSFEYALWALDKHMWAAMIACIPNEEGKKVFAQLISQYNKVNTDGVTYRLNEKIITEKHFDFENTIIKELQTQVDSIATHNPNWDAIDKQWREGVGDAQKKLPMHVVYEYCSNKPFDPVPKFTVQPKSSKQFYNSITEKNENWFGVDSKLGSGLAIYKVGLFGVRALGAPRAVALWGSALFDLEALKALCEARTTDFIDLKAQLEESADNHHQSCPDLTVLAICR